MRELENRFERELVVIGVHSGKFRAERVTENIRQAVLRLEIEHPVVNDRHFRIWRSYAVNAWPTIALLNPDGRHVGSHSGEFTAASLAPTIDGIIKDGDARGKIDRRVMHFRPERLAEPDRPLAFPGKVLTTTDGLLYVADTGHNRIVVARLSSDGLRGTVEHIVGGKIAGFADGPFNAATFNHPQGLALIKDRLFVADTENHAIRVIDFATGSVETVAGTGEQARRLTRGGPGRSVDLNSPWDILAHHGGLYIAMAGSHQIWRLDPASGEIHPHAGTGHEALVDGPLDGSVLAQPSGLAADEHRLYFSDSESSAIRWCDFGPAGRVGTIVGTGLFDFGDVDGTGDGVLLQHPLGIVWLDRKLYVVDTYNDKVKLIDPDTREAVTLVGASGAEELADRPTFDEPGGISAVDGKLYVADTNNHRVCVVEIRSRAVSPLGLEGLE